MIINRAERYIFVQVPHTGSTAVGRELQRHYAGQPICSKHSTFTELQRREGKEFSEFFVFAAIRNPIDEVRSLYYKLKHDHKGIYSNPENYVQNGGWIQRRGQRRFHFVQRRGVTFEEYLKRYYRLPYVNWITYECSKYDFIMRFERLQHDFADALARIGLSQIRPLPTVNVTDKPESSFESAYPPIVHEHVAKVFGPYMEYWNYELPAHWDVRGPTVLHAVLFKIMLIVKGLYWRHKERISRYL